MRPTILALSLFTFTLLFGFRAYAQTTTTTMTAPPEHRFELSGGFSHMTADIGLNGWNADIAYKPSERVALVGDFAGLYGDDNLIGIRIKSNIHNFLAGPRVYFRMEQNEKIRPFGHLMFGGSIRSTTVTVAGFDRDDSSFTWALGGGADYDFAPNWAARGRADLIRVNFEDEGDVKLRFGFGVVYRFGR